MHSTPNRRASAEAALPEQPRRCPPPPSRERALEAQRFSGRRGGVSRLGPRSIELLAKLVLGPNPSAGAGGPLEADGAADGAPEDPQTRRSLLDLWGSNDRRGDRERRTRTQSPDAEHVGRIRAHALGTSWGSAPVNFSCGWVCLGGQLWGRSMQLLGFSMSGVFSGDGLRFWLCGMRSKPTRIWLSAGPRVVRSNSSRTWPEIWSDLA